MAVERVPAGLGGAASHGSLLDLIRSTGGLSRQQLLAATGMSRATLYERLDALVRRGLVYEAEPLEATGGRRSRKIRFDDRGRVILAFALGQTHATVSVTDTGGRQLRTRTLAHRISESADTVLGPLLAAGAELLEQETSEILTGVGVSVPSPVEAATGHVVHSTTIPGWPPDAVVAAMSGRWPVPLVIENDARTAALGERRTDAETLVYIKVATGIGCGIVVDGSILHGAHGAAGDIGHIRVAPNGPVCSCGRHGCLATFSSGRSLGLKLGPAGYPTLPEISAAARRDEPVVIDALTAAADVLGRALATTVTTINPDRLVLGGTIGVLPAFVDQVRERVMSDVVGRIAKGLTVEGGAAGDDAALEGLTTLVMRKVFAPAAIDGFLLQYALS
ncbi:ROK family transcriptional regulator [Arthrobacter sp. MSA 4-2]|uniref:ROK family transcriptional regulator n=1 Tax=Arthrobacter sp. MSA 4-2 TaxID=2794349 RepID=UPI0018E82C3A|nr:ROK family transcriptional regulator [Arthrobacter sp. MSA 4-2]MBJ2122448.1 ROK family transcriptional regulator [Arthrobacter sp. MSA 4-2]